MKVHEAYIGLSGNATPVWLVDHWHNQFLKYVCTDNRGAAEAPGWLVEKALNKEWMKPDMAMLHPSAETTAPAEPAASPRPREGAGESPTQGEPPQPPAQAVRLIEVHDTGYPYYAGHIRVESITGGPGERADVPRVRATVPMYPYSHAHVHSLMRADDPLAPVCPVDTSMSHIHSINLRLRAAARYAGEVRAARAIGASATPAIPRRSGRRRQRTDA